MGKRIDAFAQSAGTLKLLLGPSGIVPKVGACRFLFQFG
jgi:hypothetical protein